MARKRSDRPEKSNRGRRPESARTRTRAENGRKEVAREATRARRKSVQHAAESKPVDRAPAADGTTTPHAPWYRRPKSVIPLVVVALVALGAVAWFTPLMSVRDIEVRGTETIVPEEILVALDIPRGQPLLRVDTTGAASRVAQIPKVESARVQRMYPSTIRVTVTERTPVVFVDAPDGTHLLDKDAVDYEVAPPPPGIPRLVTESPGFGDPETNAALEVLVSMPDQLRGQVAEVTAGSISDISVKLHDGRVVVWGGTEKSERKGAVTLALLTQPGGTYDVSSPDLPTVR